MAQDRFLLYPGHYDDLTSIQTPKEDIPISQDIIPPEDELKGRHQTRKPIAAQVEKPQHVKTTEQPKRSKRFL